MARTDQVVAFLRRHPGAPLVAIVVTAALVAAVLSARLPFGEDGEPSDQPAAEGSTSQGDDGPSPGSSAPSGDSAGDPTGSDGDGGDGDGDPATGSTATDPASPPGIDVPLDVDHPRPAFDLDAEPDPTDPVELASWWAATYTAYSGAESADELAERLSGHSARRLRARLAAGPAPASLGLPLSIVGVSAGRPVAEPTGAGGASTIRVTVETATSMAVYQLGLEQQDGRWQVSEVISL